MTRQDRVPGADGAGDPAPATRPPASPSAPAAPVRTLPPGAATPRVLPPATQPANRPAPGVGYGAPTGRAPASSASGSPAASSDRPSRWWLLAMPFLLLAGAASVFFSQRHVGYAWDESYYYEPSKAAAAWIERAAPEFGGIVATAASDLVEWGAGLFDDGGPKSFGEIVREASDGLHSKVLSDIDAAWSERSEHPSVQKILSGFSLLLLEDGLGPIAAMRAPMAILFGLTLCLIYLLGRRAWSAGAGFLAAFAYGVQPQIFGLSHFATMEPVLLFMTVLVVYCFARGIDSRFWSLPTGVAFGALLATKINGFFLLPPLVLWGYLYHRRTTVHNFFWMATLGPAVFVLLWPWLWPDPVNRFLDYLQFHATHQQTASWFQGTKWGYGGPNAPWTYPSVMIGITTPVAVLALAGLGALAAAFRLFRRPLPALFLLVMLVTWAVASAPGTPKYDGIRLFAPLFPFLALMAGGGADLLLAIGRWADRRHAASSPYAPKSARSAFLLGLFVLLALGVDGGFGMTYHPHLLSYFNPLVGGIAGAEKAGYEVTWWGEVVDDEVLEELDETIPDGASLKLLALHELNFQQLQKWGALKPGIRLDAEPPYNYHLLLWRRGFFGTAEKLLADSGRYPPIRSWEEGGVTLLSLHETVPFPVPGRTPGGAGAGGPLGDDSATTPTLGSSLPGAMTPGAADSPTTPTLGATIPDATPAAPATPPLDDATTGTLALEPPATEPASTDAATTTTVAP